MSGWSITFSGSWFPVDYHLGVPASSRSTNGTADDDKFETVRSVEVCIVAFGSAEVIANAIRSVARIPNSSVAVCDNSSNGTSVEPARLASKEVEREFRLLRAPLNPGFGISCNLLAESSKADWLVFLNPDAVITAWPWDQEGPPRDHVLGAVQSTSDGRPLQAYGNQYGVGEEIRRSWLRRPSPRPDGAGFVGGGAMAVERRRFLEVGEFDSRFFLFYEDIDFCFRANQYGLPVSLAESWTVEHDVGHAARKNLCAALLASYTSGRIFHHIYRHSLYAYDLYIVLDSALRMTRMLLRRDSAGQDAYRSLMRYSAGFLWKRPRKV